MTTSRLPYPGLRAFRRDESDIFFGRESLIDTMVDKLAQTRFLAVLGSSGSGKSSLVRTGLLDALELGLSPELGSQWVVVDTHPGSSPFENLARAMLGAVGGTISDDSVRALVSYLRRGPRSLQQWYDDNRLAPKRLLVLVDQFEELFRYSDFSRGEEAEAFSTLLVESTQAEGTNILAIVTMRSEYLGACSLIPGLTECINEGLFLTPRMTRSQCLQAIEGPARVVGFRIDPALSNRILNDITAFAPWEEDPNADQLHRISQRADQLPLMQHVLNRLWQQAGAGATGAVTLTEAMYVQAGGLRNSLGAHGNEIMHALPAGLGKTCERVFRGLVSGSGILAVRRPCTLDTLVALAGGDRAGVVKILDLFRSPSCNFILPELTTPLTGATVVDISHESLIRQWPLLTDWAAREEIAGFQWQRLSDSARRNADGQTDFLNGRELAAYLGWWDEEAPNETWASRYGNAFDLTKAYLDTSNDLHVKEVAALALAAQKRTRRMVLASIAVMTLLVIMGVTVKFLSDRHAERESLKNEVPREAWAALNDGDGDPIKSVRVALAGIALANQAGEDDLKPYGAVLAAAMVRAGPVQYTFSHEDRAGSVAISSDGQYLVSSGSDNKAVLRRIDGTAIKVLQQQGRVSEVAFSKDGSRICTAGADGTANLWDGRTGGWQRRLEPDTQGQKDALYVCSFSADGHEVMTAGGSGQVMVWDPADGHIVAQVSHAQYNGSDRLYDAVLSPDGRQVITIGQHAARLWNLADGKSLGGPSNGSLSSYSAAFSHDSRKLIIAGGGAAVTVLDNNGKRLFDLGQGDQHLGTVAFTPDDQYIVGRSGGYAKVYSAVDGTYLTTLANGSGFNSIEFSTDGRRMALEGQVSTIWDIKTFAWQQTVAGNLSGSAALSGDGRHLAATGGGGAVRVWRLANRDDAVKLELPTNVGDVLHTRSGSDRLNTEISTDGRRISGRFLRTIARKNDAILSQTYAVGLWDVSGKLLRTVSAVDGDGMAIGATYVSPDSRYFVVTRYRIDSDTSKAAVDCSLDVFNAENGDLLRRISYVGSCFSLDFVANSSIIAVQTLTPITPGTPTAGIINGIGLWDLKNGEKIGQIQGPKDTYPYVMASSPGGDLLAVSVSKKGSSSTLLWDIKHNRPSGIQLQRQGNDVEAAAFSRDGRLLATGGDDRKITIWAMATGKPLGKPFKGSADAISSIVFAPNGRFLVSNADGTPGVWDMDKRSLSYVLSESITDISADSSKFLGDDGVVLDTAGHGMAAFDGPAGTYHFTADGKGLITIDGNVYVHHWSFAPLETPLATTAKEVCGDLLSKSDMTFSGTEIKAFPALDNNHWKPETDVCDAVLKSSALEDKNSGWRGWLHKATAWLPEGMRPQ